ncbi:nucleotide exchange factor SIL1-like [Hydractinia symbiolongicarpus]|uniref:nucleotide exchange factor SIL1-like n=1 Tax=Hydractinia symbiolongicarpus TaxID=13093 RepID=UPI00254B1DB5|nr:nucleotide exchange factor SIL1-like [Hydractinia symbiolongicarpus]
MNRPMTKTILQFLKVSYLYQMKLITLVFLALNLGNIVHGNEEKTGLILSDANNDENENTVAEDKDVNYETFVPTNEWQVVKDSQAIPAGLHVRMNFQTGIKEAKLLKDDESIENESPKSVNLAPKITVDGRNKYADKIRFSKAQLKDALSGLGDNEVPNDIKWSDEAIEAIKQKTSKKFKENTPWKTKSDLEVMKDNMALLTNSSQSLQMKIDALTRLEDYVHQIDNARDLDHIHGLETIVQFLNATEDRLKEKAANVISAAAQNNKEVQNAVLKYNGLQYLLRMLYPYQTPLIRKKGIYALSALVRGNYEGQKELVKLQGIKDLFVIARDVKAGSLRVKAVVLLHDLIVDLKDREATHESWSLLNLYVENGWCELLIPLLDTTDIDVEEKIIQALTLTFEACQIKYKSRQVDMTVLKKVLDQLNSRIKVEDDDEFKDYLQNLHTNLNNNVIKKL